MVKEKSKDMTAKEFFKTVTYGTGLLCKKMAGLRKVTQTKSWKHAMSVTQEICDTVGAKTEAVIEKVTSTVEKGSRDISKSFKAGMESVVDGPSKVKSPASRAASSLKGKVKGKIRKVKSPAKKARIAAAIEKEAPAEAALEKEIDNVTREVEGV